MSSAVVASVSRLTPRRSSNRRHATNAAEESPASLMQNTHHWKYTVPPCTKNTFRRAVTTTMNSKGPMERSAWPNGMRARA